LTHRRVVEKVVWLSPGSPFAKYNKDPDGKEIEVAASTASDHTLRSHTTPWLLIITK
jgi:hypothetical protein